MIKAAADGSYFAAGDAGDNSELLYGDAMSILGHNVVEDTDSETLAVAVYVSGGFNQHAITGVNNYALTEGDVLSAQKYGLYIHS